MIKKITKKTRVKCFRCEKRRACEIMALYDYEKKKKVDRFICGPCKSCLVPF